LKWVILFGLIVVYYTIYFPGDSCHFTFSKLMYIFGRHNKDKSMTVVLGFMFASKPVIVTDLCSLLMIPMASFE